MTDDPAPSDPITITPDEAQALSECLGLALLNCSLQAQIAIYSTNLRRLLRPLRTFLKHQTPDNLRKLELAHSRVDSSTTEHLQDLAIGIVHRAALQPIVHLSDALPETITELRFRPEILDILSRRALAIVEPGPDSRPRSQHEAQVLKIIQQIIERLILDD